MHNNIIIIFNTNIDAKWFKSQIQQIDEFHQNKCNMLYFCTVEATLCNTGNAQHDAQDRLLSRCNDFFPPRQRAVRYNPRLIRLNVARCKRGWKRMRETEREREIKGDREVEAEAVTRVWRFARNHRATTIAIATTTVSPDERGSNSPRRKITLSRDTEHGVEGRGETTARRGAARRWRKGWTGRESECFLYFLSSPNSLTFLRRTYVKYRRIVAVLASRLHIMWRFYGKKF